LHHLLGCALFSQIRLVHLVRAKPLDQTLATPGRPVHSVHAPALPREAFGTGKTKTLGRTAQQNYRRIRHRPKLTEARGPQFTQPARARGQRRARTIPCKQSMGT
jgi:hypothetical protein